MTHVLLLEDDFLISKSLKMSLAYQGFNVEIATTLMAAEQLYANQEFDLLILDVNLPDGDSFGLCQRIRAQNPKIPILMLTARIDEESAIKGLSGGADDYIRKPFGIQELTLRMKKLLNHSEVATKTLQFGTLKIDVTQHRAWAASQELNLGKREFDVLTLLVRKQGAVVTREEIIALFGDQNEIFDRTIDSHLSHIRKKLREVGADKIAIAPVYGVGYRLEIVGKAP
jgi:DNA-binding response OmpR family regulator